MSYDSILKFVVEAYPQAFVKWLLNLDARDITVLQVENNFTTGFRSDR